MTNQCRLQKQNNPWTAFLPRLGKLGGNLEIRPRKGVDILRLLVFSTFQKCVFSTFPTYLCLLHKQTEAVLVASGITNCQFIHSYLMKLSLFFSNTKNSNRDTYYLCDLQHLWIDFWSQLLFILGKNMWIKNQQVYKFAMIIPSLNLY